MAGKRAKEKIPPSRADIILHPTRFKILMTITGRPMTAQQLAAVLPDVAQASLYRYLSQLCEAGILEIVEDGAGRGTTEKTYRLPEEAAVLTTEETAVISPEDHLRYFTTFTAMMLSKFRGYLHQKALDGRTGGTYRTEALNLNDVEYEHFVAAMRALEGLAKSNEPGPGRRRRMVFTAIIPDVEDSP